MGAGRRGSRREEEEDRRQQRLLLGEGGQSSDEEDEDSPRQAKGRKREGHPRRGRKGDIQRKANLSGATHVASFVRRRGYLISGCNQERLCVAHSPIRCVSHYRSTVDTPGTNDPPTVPPIPLLSSPVLASLPLCSSPWLSPPPLSSASLMGRAREFV